MPDLFDRGAKVCEVRPTLSSVGTAAPGSSFQWSSRATAPSQARPPMTRHVDAGTPGSFTLTLVVSKNGCSSQCEKTVSVRANPGCKIDGPDPVCAGSTPLVYRTTPGANLNFLWSITGNGSIVGATNVDSVQSRRQCGSFKLTLVVTQTTAPSARAP